MIIRKNSSRKLVRVSSSNKSRKRGPSRSRAKTKRVILSPALRMESETQAIERKLEEMKKTIQLRNSGGSVLSGTGVGAVSSSGRSFQGQSKKSKKTKITVNLRFFGLNSFRKIHRGLNTRILANQGSIGSLNLPLYHLNLVSVESSLLVD